MPHRSETYINLPKKNLMTYFNQELYNGYLIIKLTTLFLSLNYQSLVKYRWYGIKVS